MLVLPLLIHKDDNDEHGSTSLPLITTTEEEEQGKRRRRIVVLKFTRPLLLLHEGNRRLRKRIKINPEKSIFLFVNNNIMAGAQLIGAVYEEHKDLDGFLYTCYSGENTFG